MKHWKECPCPDCMRKREHRRALLGALLIAALIVGVLLLGAGCSSTVTPAPVESRQASFDQGEQNSGILALVPGGALITPRARERYNSLVSIYGRDFLPPLVLDFGIQAQPDEPRRYIISNEALQKFILMNAWHRMGREPGKTK